MDTGISPPQEESGPSETLNHETSEGASLEAETSEVYPEDPQTPSSTSRWLNILALVAGLVAMALGPLAGVLFILLQILAYYGLAGEVAAQSCKGPGSFQVALLDALYGLDEPGLEKGARIRA